MSEKEQIIKDSLSLTVTNYAAYFVSLLRGFLVRRLLGPNLFGFYSILTVIRGYGGYSNLGTRTAAEKELPYLIGKKDCAKVERTKNVAISFIILAASIGTFILFLSTFFYAYSDILQKGIRIISLVIFFTEISSYFTIILRSYKRFILIGKVTIFSSLVGLVAATLLTYFFSLKGALFSLVLVPIFIASYIWLKTNYRFKILFDFKETKKLIKIGIPLIVLTLMYLTMISIDRIMIYSLINPTAVGYYSIALIVSSFAFFLPKQVGIVMFPRFREKYGQTENIGSLSTYLLEPTKVIAYTMPIFIGSLFILTPPLIKLLLPQYLPGIKAMKILIMGFFFFSLTHMSSSLLITLSRERRMIAIQGVCIICSILLDYLFIKAGLGIEGVALGTSLVYLLYSTWLISYALSYFKKRFSARLKFFGFIYSPIFYTIIILFISGYLLKFIPISGEIYRALIEFVLFGLLSMPLIFIGYKKTKLSLLKPLLLQRVLQNREL